MKHEHDRDEPKCKRVEDGVYDYCGIKIIRRDHIPAGKYGRWYAHIDNGESVKSGSLKDMKDSINFYRFDSLQQTRN